MTNDKTPTQGAAGAKQFDFLLNRFERAAQSAEPAANDYAVHRRALYDYVRNLEELAAQPVEAPGGGSGDCG